MVTAEAVVDLAALRNNLARLKSCQPDSKMVAVVKGNAYGHGSVEVSRALNEWVDSFAVARFEEAVVLRHAGISKPIVLLEGCFDQDETDQAIALNFQPVIQNDEQIAWIRQSLVTEKTNFWLKVDTGMHRLGFSLEEIADKHRELLKLAAVDSFVGFVSHLSCADEQDSSRTDEQLAHFIEATKTLVGPRSLANSAALLTRRDIAFDKARPGIALYGVTPFAGRCGQDEQLEPVMTLKSKLIAVRDHKKGEPVGYGGLWQSQSDTRLGVVAIGYGDGYPRTMPTGTPVLVNGRKVPLVGRVSMDMLTVDLGAQASDRVGDEVILWGKGNPVEPLAERVGTIGYELLIQLTSRVKRTYIESAS
ncbi:alanine racemase [Celerinatantimonas diazotrophica]|uniref:Alanine racemase n=1 Tax=Celerinatantimonas diazotrophica TaxID=412034 RepID=A0A4R1J7J5_9GAMM|nr:alanine racemase [Celerinatantimonas diazotrophica]TCK46491.1 alanine racemase [Celerinatantimonas diazotrophica]CAG9296541.1 Alanine racemase, biosynthetic [Celerinatantimonas diazotrophica]